MVEQPVNGPRRGLVLCARIRDDQAVITEAEVSADVELTPLLLLKIPPEYRRSWTPENPYLYHLSILLKDISGRTIDEIATYAALRSVSVSDGALSLNGKRRFQRLVLDQGCWPTGGLTAPDDDALARDIIIAKAAGFDGARAHQRVAEERWLDHADRLGYLVWGEFPDWANRRNGPPVHHLEFSVEHVGQWLEVLHRDYSHPCIVGWCALNETEQPYGGQLSDLDDITKALYLAARVADASRPVIDVSGYSHRIGDADVWDCHDYEQNPSIFAGHYRLLPQFAEGAARGDTRQLASAPRPGQAIIVSEFGGTRIADSSEEQNWGYGPAVASAEELLQKFSALCRVLLSNKHVSGYCYTQLTDTYQEKNGLFDAEREPKVAPNRLAEAQSAVAAIAATP
jgi:beta-glucuronidase